MPGKARGLLVNCWIHVWTIEGRTCDVARSHRGEGGLHDEREVLQFLLHAIEIAAHFFQAGDGIAGMLERSRRIRGR